MSAYIPQAAAVYLLVALVLSSGESFWIYVTWCSGSSRQMLLPGESVRVYTRWADRLWHKKLMLYNFPLDTTSSKNLYNLFRKLFFQKKSGRNHERTGLHGKWLLKWKRWWIIRDLKRTLEQHISSKVDTVLFDSFPVCILFLRKSMLYSINVHLFQVARLYSAVTAWRS